MCYSRHTDSLDMSLPPLQENVDEDDELVALKPTHIALGVDRADDELFTWPGVQLLPDAPVPKSMSDLQGLQVETGQLCCQL
jgi:hypothetical protein